MGMNLQPEKISVLNHKQKLFLQCIKWFRLVHQKGRKDFEQEKKI